MFCNFNICIKLFIYSAIIKKTGVNHKIIEHTVNYLLSTTKLPNIKNAPNIILFTFQKYNFKVIKDSKILVGRAEIKHKNLLFNITIRKK